MLHLVMDGEYKNSLYKSGRIYTPSGIVGEHVDADNLREIDMYDRFEYIEINEREKQFTDNTFHIFSQGDGDIYRYGRGNSYTIGLNATNIKYKDRLPDDYFEDKLFFNGSHIFKMVNNELYYFTNNQRAGNIYDIMRMFHTIDDNRSVSIDGDVMFKDLDLISITHNPHSDGTIRTVIQLSDESSVVIYSPSKLTEVAYIVKGHNEIYRKVLV